MHDLAHNVNGDPFEPPADATAWRVRRIRPRGAPEPVFGSDGLPLVLPLDAAPEDLRRSVTEAGRYRLDPINENYHPIEGAPSGYLYVYPHHLRNGAAPNGTYEHEGRERRDTPSSVGGMEAAFIEMAKVVTTMAQTVVQTMTTQFPAMLEAAAVLVRAADGAGLPARPPMAIANDQDDDDENDDKGAPPVSAAAGPDLATVIAQTLPAVLAAFASKNAAPPAAPSGAASERSAAPRSAETKPDASAVPPAVLSHFLAIQQELTPPERALAKALVSELAPEHRRSWLGELAEMPVPAAADRVRALLHSEPRKEPSAKAPAKAPAPEGSDAPGDAAPAMRPETMTEAMTVPPAAMAHFLAIQQALTPQERALAQGLASELAPGDLRAWMTELSAMSVPAAVERLRALLHGEPTKPAPMGTSASGGGS